MNKHNLIQFIHKDIFFLLLLFTYFILRFTFGVNEILIYSIAIGLIIIRFSFEKIALFYFILSIITFMLNSTIEANHYMSFVYASMILSFFTVIIQNILKFKNEK